MERDKEYDFAKAMYQERGKDWLYKLDCITWEGTKYKDKHKGEIEVYTQRDLFINDLIDSSLNGFVSYDQLKDFEEELKGDVLERRYSDKLKSWAVRNTIENLHSMADAASGAGDKEDARFYMDEIFDIAQNYLGKNKMDYLVSDINKNYFFMKWVVHEEDKELEEIESRMNYINKRNSWNKSNEDEFLKLKESGRFG